MYRLRISLRSAASMQALSAAWLSPFSGGSYPVRGIGFAAFLLGLPGRRSLVCRRGGLAPSDLGALERLPIDVEGVVAGGEVAMPVVHQRRFDFLADVRHVATAWMEATAGGRVDRAGDVAL